jgi:cell division protein FtsB
LARTGGTKKSLDDSARRRRRLPLLIAAALVAAAVFISLFRDMGVVAVWKLRNTEQQLRTEVERLRRENADLKAQVEGLRSNPAVIEDEARRIGLIREKEKVIVVPQSPNARTQAPAKPGAPR